jgi:hypothetical protein
MGLGAYASSCSTSTKVKNEWGSLPSDCLWDCFKPPCFHYFGAALLDVNGEIAKMRRNSHLKGKLHPEQLLGPKAAKLLFAGVDYRRHATQFLARVSVTLNSSDLRNLESSTAARSQGIQSAVSLQELPRETVNLEIQAPFAAAFFPSSSNELPHLSISWGGPRYMYGLLVGSPEFQPAPVNNELILKWTDGIYVFHSSGE